SIIARPIRSFTEPPGLKNSALAYSGVRIPWVSLLRRTSGVHPIVSRTFAYGLVCAGTAVRFRLARVPPHGARIPRRGGGVAPHAGGIREHAGGHRPSGARIRPEHGGRRKRGGCVGGRRPPYAAAIRFSLAGRPRPPGGAAELDPLAALACRNRPQSARSRRRARASLSRRLLQPLLPCRQAVERFERRQRVDIQPVELREQRVRPRGEQAELLRVGGGWCGLVRHVVPG